jgi:hypothetical protein
MPIFRIAAALAILWLIKPEVIGAPAAYIASAIGRTVEPQAAREARETAESIARICAATPQACKAIAAEALARSVPPSTGSVMPDR